MAKKRSVSSTVGPSRDAAAKLATKRVVGSRLRTRGWDAIKAGLRDRAFFSAGVEEPRWLSTAQEKLLRVLEMQREQLENGDEAFVDRSSFIGDMRRAAQEAGLATRGEDLQDPASRSRLGLIYDMQIQSAQGYAARKIEMDDDVLDAFPAQELVRLEQRMQPRDWQQRWTAGGGKLYGGRMIALKTDEVWTKISRFGTPWPPFDFGSGMGLKDVGRDEAEQLGVLKAGEKVKSNDPDFNAELEASVSKLRPEYQAALKNIFGDDVEVEGDRARWRAA